MLFRSLLFESGRYDFHPEGAAVREYYISNHDQDNPKTVGFPLEDWKGLAVADRGYVLETGRIVTEGTGTALLESDTIRKAYLGG